MVDEADHCSGVEGGNEYEGSGVHASQSERDGNQNARFLLRPTTERASGVQRCPFESGSGSGRAPLNDPALLIVDEPIEKRLRFCMCAALGGNRVVGGVCDASCCRYCADLQPSGVDERRPDHRTQDLVCGTRRQSGCGVTRACEHVHAVSRRRRPGRMREGRARLCDPWYLGGRRGSLRYGTLKRGRRMAGAVVAYKRWQEHPRSVRAAGVRLTCCRIV